MKDERTGCIYMITCLMNGNMYIGLTTQDIYDRFSEHMRRPNRKMKIDINKYSKSNFKIEPITENNIPENNLGNVEIHYIGIYKPKYNTSKGGVLGPNLSGEEIYTAKLSNNEAYTIRNEFYDGKTVLQLMQIYNVGKSTINDIISGRSYKEIGGPLRIVRKKKTNEIAKLIRELYIEGRSVSSLCKEFGGIEDTVRDIIKGKSFKNAGGPIKGVDY